MLSLYEEKKVEYLELIYDLVFVYMVGRNNSLLGYIEDGFISPEAFIAYIICTLAIIQIWSYTTFYINMFGRNGLRDHVFLCVNMYLMYFVGEATRFDWINYKEQYHIAWALILVNTGVQYMIELRNHQADVWNRDIIKRMMATLFIEAAIVFAAAWPGPLLVTVLSAAAILTGMVLNVIHTVKSPGGTIDFSHLTERAMLYVVFTFGEMIIAVSAYFKHDGTFSWSTLYYSLMGFLIVVGLFISYEIIYDHLIDRDKADNGMMYMLIHIFIIFSLNNITASLEFMRESHVALTPKMIFLVASVIAYYLFLFLTRGYTKATCRLSKGFVAKLAGLTIAFAVLMLALKEHSQIHIFLTVAYVFAIMGELYLAKRRVEKGECL